MRVTFESRNGEEKDIGFAENEKEALDIINKFLEDHNYKSYYQRRAFIEEKQRYWIDVGSWSEFFYIYI